MMPNHYSRFFLLCVKKSLADKQGFTKVKAN